MPYSALRDKKQELIRKARTGSVFTGPMSAPLIAALTSGASSDLAALNAAYDDLGHMTTAGATYDRKTDTSEVKSFGSVEPTRMDITSDVITLKVIAQETKKQTIELTTGADLSALTVNATTGEFIVDKPALPQAKYNRILGLFVDTDDQGREIYFGRFMPRARMTEIGAQQYNDGGDPIAYEMTFTGFEDSSAGFSHRWLWGGPGWKALLTTMGF